MENIPFTNLQKYIQVPGRMGLLVTLDLIATNVYNSVEAPTQRGLSYIEIWMIGVQIPILVGIFEYGILLAMRKYYKPNNSSIVVKFDSNDSSTTEGNIDMDSFGKAMDKWTFTASLLFIFLFHVFYWISTRI